MDYEALYREIAAYEYEQAMYEATVFAAHMYPIVSDVPARVAEVVRLRQGVICACIPAAIMRVTSAIVVQMNRRAEAHR